MSRPDDSRHLNIERLESRAMLSADLFVTFSKANMLAADGRCKTFDQSADGFGRGEGCGAVVMKRLSDAQRDGDRVLAVIRGTAITHNGHNGALTGSLRPKQTCQHAGYQVHGAAADVADQGWWRKWRIVGLRRKRKRARDPDVIEVVTCVRCHRTGLTPAREASIDESRVVTMYVVRPEAQSLHDARSKALDQAIRGGDQLLEG